ncbi:hypothetical protein K488DRAFT_31288, partial [Vararia minispora EC-137]
IEIEDILALRRTSKRFMTVTKLRWVWSDALARQVIERKIPVPASVSDFKTLPSQELEARALHATTFERNWTSSNPRPRRVFEYAVAEGEDVDPITHVRFLPGHNGQLVLSVQQSRIVCWEVPLTGEDAFIVAERQIPGGTIVDVVVNEDEKNLATLVLVWSTPAALAAPPQSFFIEAWSLDRFYGTFGTLRSDAVAEHVQGRVVPLSSLVGDVAMVGDPVAVWNWSRPGSVYALNGINAQGSPPDNLLAVKTARDYIFVVRQSHLQIIPFPQFSPDGTPLPPRTDAGAVFIHLPDVASEAIIVVHPIPEEEHDKWQFDPVTIILRVIQDNGLHAIRTYDILPRSVATQLDAAPLCCSGCGMERQRILASQLPFRPPMTPSFTYVVPPSCEKLAIGPHGRGIWLETRNVRRSHTTYPARAFVGFDVRTVLNNDWQNSVVVREAPLYTARAGSGEVALKRYRILDAALEDTVGRIVVGCRDGRVQIMDFA